MIVCSVIRTRRYLARANRTLAVRVLEKGGKVMKKSQLKLTLLKIISNLDEIIRSGTEQTPGLAEVKKCRKNLQKALTKISARGKAVDLSRILLRVYKLIDCLHFFIFGKS
jgi:hypothetical protein